MPLKSHTLSLMGTDITLLIDSEHADQLISDCVKRLHQYHHRFSANDVTSELMAINRMAGIGSVKVHPELLELISLGQTHSLASPSQLNIAIGPLVDLWRIGFSDARIPQPTEIKETLKLINPQHIHLNKNNQSVFLSQKKMGIDLGAIAKGYIADRIIDYLKSQAVTSAIINIGGNVLVYGPNPKRFDHRWYIGIQNPSKKRGQAIGMLKIQNQSVVTSGVYERRLVHEGQTYHHILDSKTGYPIESEMISLTIVSDASVDGDIWTSRLFGLPLKQVISTLNATPEIEGLILTKAQQVILSEGLKQNYQSFYDSDLTR